MTWRDRSQSLAACIGLGQSSTTRSDAQALRKVCVFWRTPRFRRTRRRRTRHRSQEWISQNDARSPTCETHVVDPDIDQQSVRGAFEDIRRPTPHDSTAETRNCAVVKTACRLLLRTGRFGPPAPRRPRGTVRPEGFGPADFLISQSDLGAAAYGALVARGAPFDAVVAIENPLRDSRAGTAVGQNGERLGGDRLALRRAPCGSARNTPTDGTSGRSIARACLCLTARPDRGREPEDCRRSMACR